MRPGRLGSARAQELIDSHPKARHDHAAPPGRVTCDAASTTVSDELGHWLGDDQPKTLGNLIELLGPRSFALISMLLMALPALPLPTGGATHALEAVTMLVALQLVFAADASP